MPEQTLGKVTAMNLKPSERHFGVIVTCGHVDGSPLWTFHTPGGAGAAMREACDTIDRAGGGWLILAVSSPPSIYRDLQGTRQDHSERGRIGGWTGTSSLRPDDPRSYEVRALSKAGRLDLLAPLGWKP